MPAKDSPVRSERNEPQRSEEKKCLKKRHFWSAFGGVVAPDGQRFLMVKQKDRAPISASQMVLVLNWFTELQQRVPTR